MAYLLLIGCQDKTEKETETVEKPAELLSKPKMVSFLVDLHLAEAKLTYSDIRNRDSLEMAFRNYEKFLYEKHDIDEAAYKKSYEYYLANMEEMNKIYSSVVDSISVLNSLEKNKDSGIEVPDQPQLSDVSK
ncbi:MAG: DUF4296 domain-containing protein [Cyclobacteriaceae bacterium]